MSEQRSTPTPMVFANNQDLAKSLRSWFGTVFNKDNRLCFVCVCNNESDVKKGFEMPPMKDGAINRALIVFVGRPIDIRAIDSWRQWAVGEKNAWELRMDFVSSSPSEDEFRAVVSKNCTPWFAEAPAHEEVAVEIGKWVTMPQGAAKKDDPNLLTMMFGSMGELLTQIEVAARRFRSAVERLDDDAKERYLKDIDKLLAEGGQAASKDGQARSVKNASLGIGNVTDRLPRVLLHGDTGVGKTLIASYLHDRCGLAGFPLHVPIPEYLGKEDMFEYSLFGYAAGNYTGGRPSGSHGLLLERVGGVVFLDEIGEANADIQAKLLAFLDHYSIRPRGWLGKPFYCPVLVVAATNRDLEEVVEGKPRFRRDLLARFTHRYPIPALRDRKQDFEFILDCLLQRESMNPGGTITEIGQGALEFLRSHSFERGNFRELEDIFRAACERTLRDGRHFLTKSDFDIPALRFNQE